MRKKFVFCLAFSLIFACSSHPTLPKYSDEIDCKEDGIRGLLYSQVGYEAGNPIRIMVRMPDSISLSEKAICRLTSTIESKEVESYFAYWGKKWNSYWWIAEFASMPDSSRWDVEVYDKEELLFIGKDLRIEKNILRNTTIRYSTVHILNIRNQFSKNGAGWMDAGAMWFESPAQSAMLMGLLDVIEQENHSFDTAFLNDLYEQVTKGCDYFPILQKKAEELGYPVGSFCHDVYGHEDAVLVNDATKAVTALYRAVQILPDNYSHKSAIYKETADRGFNWLLNDAKPEGNRGFHPFQRGLPDSIKVPENEWQTRDLVMFCWAALEKYQCGDKEAKVIALQTAKEVISRQIMQDKAENGYYGHFREYASMDFSEKSWAHNPYDHYAADLGQVFPNYLMPLIEMVQLWPNHPDVSSWKQSLNDFAYGYLIPACEDNPFKIVPLGIFGEEGPIYFAGQFHGTNCIYGFTAALSLELEQMFKEPRLGEIAYGNLQWIAGLNAGITKESLELGCFMPNNDVPEGIALPASMINGIGNRSAGTWVDTRGVICNGFSTGKQFKLDVAPLQENDGPFSLTDEEWLPHVGGWLAGVSRLH